MTDSIAIQLGANAATLTPSLKAATTISREFGGFLNAYRQIAELSLTAFAKIISAALDRDPKDVEPGVYDTGMQALAGPVVDFLGRCINGGRPLDLERLNADVAALEAKGA